MKRKIAIVVINVVVGLFPDFVSVSPKNHLRIAGRCVDVVS